MTYLRNISGSTDQNSFTGAVKSNDAMFNSDYSQEFWSVLVLSLPISRLMKFSSFLRLVIEAIYFLPLLGTGSLLLPFKNELRQQES
jgi:hypothetical protein